MLALMLWSSFCCTTHAFLLQLTPPSSCHLPHSRLHLSLVHVCVCVCETDLKRSFPLSSALSSLLLTLNLCRVYFCFLSVAPPTLMSFFPHLFFFFFLYVCLYCGLSFWPGLIRLNAVAISLALLGQGWSGGKGRGDRKVASSGKPT